MTLANIIAILSRHDPKQPVPLGFGKPHSYRGDYADLAFEPVEHTTVGKMLDAAKEARGSTYCGWKGGEFEMNDWTECHLANQGDTGETLGPTLLRFMLGEIPHE